MLPPPTTMAISTPRCETFLTSAAILRIRTGSAPYSRSPISASPESFRRMRPKAAPSGGAGAAASSAIGLTADLEAREATDHDVLAGARRDLGAQVLDRL